MNSESHYPYVSLSKKRFLRIQLLIEDMEECLGEMPLNFDLLRAELWQLIFLVEKEYVLNGNQGRKDNSPNYIPKFINLVNNNFRQYKEPAFYAESLNISPGHLGKLVKSRLGVSVKEYILNRSISEAKLLLRLTDLNIKEVAHKTGFDDPNYFTRLFKKYESLTPGEYQKRGSL